MSKGNEKLDEALALLQELKRTTSRTLENHSAQLANDLQLIAGLSALLENHTAALNAHQNIIESLAAKACVVVAATNPSHEPGGQIN